MHKAMFLIVCLSILFSGILTASENEPNVCSHDLLAKIVQNQPYCVFYEQQLSHIKPTGWIAAYLQKQADGLCGHIEVAGYPFDTDGWSDYEVKFRHGENWWPYEQVGYWVDGAVRCGLLIGHTKLTERARKQIYYVLEHPAEDGYMGPEFLRETQGWANFWPFAVVFRGFTAEYDATDDKSILDSLQKHFFAEPDRYQGGRNVLAVETIVWLYARTGDPKLLEMAKKSFSQTLDYSSDLSNPETGITVENMLSDWVPLGHGVSYNETWKLGAIMYSVTGDERYLKASINAAKKLDQYHLLANGAHSTEEFMRGNDALALTETCNISDYSWSTGYLLMATGDAQWSDKIERIVFNAGMGCIKKDFKAHQYFASPNQCISDSKSVNRSFTRGSHYMAYWPKSGTECCTGNVHRFLPNYAARMWMRDKHNHPAAVLYGPSILTTSIDGCKVVIEEKTDYPFSDDIEFAIETEKEIEFTLHLRIPSWCYKPEISVNGEPVNEPFERCSFYALKRIFRNGDKVTIKLPAPIRIDYRDRGGIAINRGPLVYALHIKEQWNRKIVEGKSSEEFPCWDVYPQSDWNYALNVNEHNIRDLQVTKNEIGNDPWASDISPLEIKVPARKVRDWKLTKLDKLLVPEHAYVQRDERRYKTFDWGPFVFTPPLPDPYTLEDRLEPSVETISLVPYGRTHLRITVFPYRGLLSPYVPN